MCERLFERQTEMQGVDQVALVTSSGCMLKGGFGNYLQQCGLGKERETGCCNSGSSSISISISIPQHQH